MKRRYTIILLVVALICTAVTAQTDEDTSRKYDAFFLEAINQRVKGNNDAAFDLLRHCVDIDSTKSEAWYFLAQYYDALKENDKAQRCVEKAASLDPDISTYQEILANLYLSKQDYPKAIEVLNRIYEANHDREDVLGALVSIYEDQQDYKSAIQTLNRLEVMEGRSTQFSLKKSGYYTQLGNKKAAIREMQKLANQYPNDLNYRGLYAQALINNGQEEKGLDIYDEILEQDPDNRFTLLALLQYEQKHGDPDVVDSLMQRVLVSKNATSQDRVSLMRQEIAESEQNGGDSTRVLYLFDRMLEQKPLDADVAMLCVAYMTLKNMPRDTITVVLDRVIAETPDNAAARLQLVDYAWRDQDMPRVVILCQGARLYNPDEMAFYYYQGVAYYQQDKLDEALNAFQNGIGVITQDSDPDIVSDFYAVMGDIYHQKGFDKEAYAAYDSCLQWKEDNVGCLNNYAYYLSETGLQLDKAEQMSLKTVKAEPKNATFLDTYAWILFRQKRYTEAKIYIDQTLQCDSDTSAVLLEHAGDIYYHVGNKQQAVEYWKQALERTRQTVGSEDNRLKIIARKIKLKKYVKE